MQQELRRRGADAAGSLCPENQSEQFRHPAKFSVSTFSTHNETSLQYTQLPTSLDHWAMVSGENVNALFTEGKKNNFCYQ